MTTYTSDQVTEWLGEIKAGVGLLDDIPRNMELAAAAIALIDEPVMILPDGYISPHFTIKELTYSDTAQQYGIDNTPNSTEMEQLSLLANQTLEGIRMICGAKAMTISSGFRCDEVNALIGGASNSAHKYGCAADFICPEFGSPIDICWAIEPHMKELGIDQLIHENNSWVHVGRAIPPSTAPRYQCMTINGSSTVQGFV